jgi:hypothetical protein
MDHINPKYLSSSELWAEGSSAEAFMKALDARTSVQTEKNTMSSPIRALLGIKKIDDNLNTDDYPTLVGHLNVSLRDNYTI